MLISTTLSEIGYSTNEKYVLFYYFFSFFFMPHHVASGIVVADQGSDPHPPALKGEVLTTGLPRKSPRRIFEKHDFSNF